MARAELRTGKSLLMTTREVSELIGIPLRTLAVNNGVKVQRGAGGKCSARGVDLFSITSGETLGKWMLPPHGEGRLWRLI